MKNIFLLLIVFFSFQSFGQQLVCKNGGSIIDENKQHITPKKAKELFANIPTALTFYKKGKSQETLGNIILLAGVLSTSGGILQGLVSDSYFPNILTGAGVAAIGISIPIKIGATKKVRAAVDEYNKSKGLSFIDNSQKIELIASNNTVGVRLTF